MDYSKMSDFDINVAVSLELFNGSSGGDTSRIATWCACKENGGYGLFDPCNNPADAWPIITESRIAIIPDTTAGEWVAFNEFTLYEGDWMFASDPAHHSNGNNPLRCAMECFLMIQESANVPVNPAGPDIR